MQSKAFTKLFASITDSSIWSEDDATRIIWITMLAMSDSHGYVGASVPGLAARSRKSVEEVETALDKFRSPDRYSRTRDYDGRRISDAKGGWVLLNYESHRAVLDAEAEKEKKRRWAAKSRAEARAAADVDCVDHESRLNRSSVDESRLWPSVSLSESVSGSESDPDPEGGRGGAVEGVTVVDPRRGRFAPADFEPSESHRVRCQELGFDIDALVREFKLFEFNRDYSHWPKRFSRWVEEAKIRRDTDRHKGTLSRKDRPNQPNCGLTGFEGAREIR